MSTILTPDNHGYQKNPHGRKGECGCHLHKSLSAWKKLWREQDRAKAESALIRELRDEKQSFSLGGSTPA